MRILRNVLLALLVSGLIGFAIGTVLRLRLERPVHYIGSAVPTDPFDIGKLRSRVLDAGHHEQQIG